MIKKDYEILAPVGSYESLFAAVRSGADAVYFGLKDFSARRNAENFTEEEMEQGVKYCKRNGVKMYLTLNIAIKDKELKSAVQTAKKAYFAGVDGFIVSDLGLAKIIHETMPDIELHASTQMSVNSPAALPLLKEMGFCRVVPAREMSKNQLIELCNEAKRLNMEVEVFVHGALCMCLSGQCLMSSVLGARSGNRGLCAGPCRLPFSAENGTGYDLSLKDLSLLKYLDELIKMGVYSFKIEGRMKRPEYIAAAVTTCKNSAEKGFTDEKSSEILEGVFSRSGFTDGYYKNSLGRQMFGVRSAEDAKKSKETYTYLHGLYRNEFQRIPVNISAEIRKDKPIKITLTAGKNEVAVLGENPKTAQNKPATKEGITALLSKLGGTPYIPESIEVLLDDGLFVSSGEINELRRNACEKMGEIFEKIPKRRFVQKEYFGENSCREKGQKIYGKFLRNEQIPENISDFDLIILPLDVAQNSAIPPESLAVDMPRFTADEKNIVSRLKRLKDKGINKALCGTLSAVKIAADNGFEVIGDIGLNVLNEMSANVLENLGLNEIILSAEMDLRKANNFNTVAKKGIFAYGRLALMCMKNCPLKNGRTCSKCDKNGEITDRLGTKFPIRCKEGYSELYNSVPIYLADKKADYKNIDFLLLSFVTETAGECEKIAGEYKRTAYPPKDFTRGLYYKELL